jgi:membrane protease YdiL (CAAX protease family)
VLTSWLAPDPELEERRREPVGWGVSDAVMALFTAQLAAIIGGIAIFVALGYDTPEEIDAAPIGALLLTQVPLWLGYAGVTLWASTRKGLGPVVDLGWRFRAADVPFGVVLGVLLQVVGVTILYTLIFLVFPDQDVSEAAKDLTDRATDPFSVVALVLIVVVGAPIVEELFFRGLLLRSLERRFGPTTALLGSSLLFGAVHLQLVQLPALVLFGLVAGWLTLRSGRLGPAIWTHVGFNGVTVLTLLLLD